MEQTVRGINKKKTWRCHKGWMKFLIPIEMVNVIRQQTWVE